MNLERLLKLELDLPRARLARFLIGLGFNLTVAARNGYRAGSDDVDTPRTLRGVNEMEHRILSYTMHLLDETEGSSYSNLVNQLVELARVYGCDAELENAIAFTFETIT